METDSCGLMVSQECRQRDKLLNYEQTCRFTDVHLSVQFEISGILISILQRLTNYTLIVFYNYTCVNKIKSLSRILIDCDSDQWLWLLHSCSLIRVLHSQLGKD